MQTQSSNITICHTLNIQLNGRTFWFLMEKFSSLQFSNPYLNTNGSFPPRSRINIFGFSHIRDALDNDIQYVLDYANDNGGFTVIGWYEHGKIIHQSIKDESDNDREEGEVAYKIVYIHPKNHIIEDTLDHLKFNVVILNLAWKMNCFLLRNEKLAVIKFFLREKTVRLGVFYWIQELRDKCY